MSLISWSEAAKIAEDTLTKAEQERMPPPDHDMKQCSNCCNCIRDLREENARLKVSRDDLLKALKGLMDSAECHHLLYPDGGYEPNTCDYDETMRPRWMAAQEAIDKSSGCLRSRGGRNGNRCQQY